MTSPSYRDQPPTPVDADYQYPPANARGANGKPPTSTTPTPTSGAPRDWQQARQYSQPQAETTTSATTGEEALLDLVQLEELHQEAERMKALGNKHMAAQEFTRAYNAYSAALQLSPVGPSSHVFLSNRAAALLSLKRYAAAATDAKRAVALAPTFGKAHARLGQALYFQKDYEGAVQAYQEAISYEPDNAVTLTYLEKAKVKLEKQKKKARGEEVSVADTNTHFTGQAASVVTQDVQQTNVVQSGGFRGQSDAVLAAANRPPPPTTSALSPASSAPPTPGVDELDIDDPDFEEALKIQQRANRYLANKQYKYAIEEYTAALFLVPDDPQLSPDLHLGRAHALNGSRRHESARNDAQLAIKLAPTPAAYSTLAKSLFYMKEYQGAIEAFEKCQEVLPKGESLGMFDKAYLQKAQAALEEASASLSLDNRSRSSKSSAPVPKLKPPRFVPREEAMQQTHNVPSMPKQWPQQIPSSPTSLRCGPEREVVFLSESLGMKLNRGPDGVVRVLSVAPHTAGSAVARDGALYVGDVVREAAGVDIRRPITNVMWGDTVALIKMAPRPITIVVANELSEVPPSVLDELKRASPGQSTSTSPGFRPSPANGDERVGQVSENNGVAVNSETVQPVTSETVIEELSPTEQDGGMDRNDGPIVQQDVSSDAPFDTTETQPNQEMSLLDIMEKEASDVMKTLGDDISDVVEIDDFLPADNVEEVAIDPLEATKEEHDVMQPGDEGTGLVKDVAEGEKVGTSAEEDMRVDVNESPNEQTSPVSPTETGGPAKDNAAVPDEEHLSPDQSAETHSERDTARMEESRVVGGEVIFDGSPPAYNGWDSLRWMSYSGARKVRLFQQVYRYEEKTQKALFWSKVDKNYVPRVLAVYEEPNIIIVLRRPVEEEGVRLVDSTDLGEIWVVESVVDPATCKLQLSNLTHPTSQVDIEHPDERSRSLFEIMSPAEKIRVSSVRVRDEAKRIERSFTDSGAFFETNQVENYLVQVICDAHRGDDDVHDEDLLRHQVILGTLHAYVLSGNTKSLDAALERARARNDLADSDERKSGTIPSRIIDAVDDSERPALFYACARKMPTAIASLVAAGARTDYRTPDHGLTLVHVCAANLDERSLAVLLGAPGRFRVDPNALDSLGRTPMFVAAIIGKTSAGKSDADALRRCLQVLHAYDGKLLIELPRWMQHPISILSSTFRTDDISAVLAQVDFHFPLKNSDGITVDNSLASLYDYPLHSALIAFLRIVDGATENKAMVSNVDLPGVVKVLLSCGFEPNERLDDSTFARHAGLRFIGYSPLQLLALAALRLSKIGSKLEQRVYGDLDAIVSTTASSLVGNGARLSLDAPPGQRTKTNGGVELGNEEESLRSQLKLDGNQKLLHLLGGVALLNHAQKGWAAEDRVEAVPSANIQTDNSIVLENSRVPGGTSDKSCAICWKPFGLLIRKHKCRVSWRYLCDECTTKKIVRDGTHRVSDGQFSLARADLARALSEKKKGVESRKESQIQSSSKSAAVARLERLEAEDEANRSSLFGGALEQAASYVFGEQDEAARTSQGLSGMVATMGETRNALLERGEKLSTLNDKSAKMVDASANFASMAKELRKKSEQGLFW